MAWLMLEMHRMESRGKNDTWTGVFSRIHSKGSAWTQGDAGVEWNIEGHKLEAKGEQQQ